MTKTLRITSVVAAILAVVLVVLPAVFGKSSDDKISELLEKPTVLETFEKTAKTRKSTEQTPPLVVQAKAFALYLDPPPAPKPISAPQPVVKKPTQPRPMGMVSAKFSLIATSRHLLKPDMSLALIDQPGKGLHWVWQSGKIGHLVVEEVKDGLIVIRDGKRTYEIEAIKQPKQSLIKGQSQPARTPAAAAVKPSSPARAASPASSARSRALKTRAAHRAARSRVQPKPVPPQELSPEQQAIMDAFMNDISAIEDPEEWLRQADEFMKKLESAGRITGEEADKLKKMPRTLLGKSENPKSSEE